MKFQVRHAHPLCEKLVSVFIGPVPNAEVFLGPSGGLHIDPSVEPASFYWVNESDWLGLTERYGGREQPIKLTVTGKKQWKIEPKISLDDIKARAVRRFGESWGNDAD